MTATTVALPKLGTTLFSFTLEMRQRGYSLEGMIDQVAERGLGPGLELVGFQSLRGYPRVSAEVVSAFRDQCERTGLEPSALSMNLDLGLHRGRLLGEDEALDYLEPQIAVAHAMGFPVCKATVIPTRSFLEGLVRILEKHGDLKFGYEVHSPMAVDAPEILRLRELYDAIDSPLLGWTPDFSASMHSVPPSLIAAHQESGMSRELTDLAIEVWNSDTTMPQKFERFAGEAPALGATPADMGKLQMLLTMHGRQDPRRWSEIMDRVVHVHAKFYGIDDHGDEPSIDNAAIIDVLVDAGYTGYLSSEWEGHAYTDSVSGWDMVAGQHELFRRLLEREVCGPCLIQQTAGPDVLVVGSGPVGAAYVRLLTEARPDLDVLLVEAGPVVSDPPGMNLRNLADPAQQERARLLAQGQALPGTDALPLDIPGTVTARQGT